MAILGAIIKTAIDLNDALSSEVNPVESQKEVLKNLLEKAKNTAFGKYYGFSKILEADDIRKKFASEIPYFDYHQMENQWSSQIYKRMEDNS